MRLWNKLIAAVLVVAVTFCSFPCDVNLVSAEETASENSAEETKSERSEESEEKETYVVSFDSDGGKNIDSQEVKAGELATKPSDPEKDGFTFDCWKNGDKEWDFENDTVSSDIMLVASYIEKDTENDNNSSVSKNEAETIFSTTPKRGLKSPALLNSSGSGEYTITIYYSYCLSDGTNNYDDAQKYDKMCFESKDEADEWLETEILSDMQGYFENNILPNYPDFGDNFIYSTYSASQYGRWNGKYKSVDFQAYYIEKGKTVLCPVGSCSESTNQNYAGPTIKEISRTKNDTFIEGDTKIFWSDTPITSSDADDVVEVQMPGSVHKIYARIIEDSESSGNDMITYLYTEADTIQLYNPGDAYASVNSCPYVDFSNFDFSNFTHLYPMFECETYWVSTTKIDFSHATGLQNINNIANMVGVAPDLTYVNLGNMPWIATAVDGHTYAYNGLFSSETCPSLQVLDLRNVDFSNVHTKIVDGKTYIANDASILAYYDYNDNVVLDTEHPPIPTYIDDDEDDIAEGQVVWSENMTVDDMKHRFVTADMLRETTEAKLVPGGTFNTTVKGGVSGSTTANTTIKSVVKVNTPFTSDTVVSTADSAYPIYWRVTDAGVLELYTEADYIVINDNASWMFAEMESLESVDFTGFKSNNINTAYCMFYNCSVLKSIDLSNFDLSGVTDIAWMFAGCKEITTIQADFSHTDVNNMVRAFADCSKLSSLDISGLKTTNCTDMSYVFYKCKTLNTIDVSSFDTSKVTTMQCMFQETAVKNLDISNFNTSNVTNMRGMFYWMTSCQSINFGDNFDMSKVTTIQDMFYNCKLLRNLDFSNTTAPNLTNASGAFNYTYLRTLNISGFDFTHVTDSYEDIFNQSLYLDYLYLGKTSVAINFPTSYNFSYGFGLDDNEDGMIDNQVTYTKSLTDGQPHLYRFPYTVKFKSNNYTTPIDASYLVTLDSHPFIPDDLMSADDRSHATFEAYEVNNRVYSWDLTKYISDYTDYSHGSVNYKPQINVLISWDDEVKVSYTYRNQFEYSQSIDSDGVVSHTYKGLNDYPSSRSFLNNTYRVRLNKPIPQTVWDKINNKCAAQGDFNSPEYFNGWYQLPSDTAAGYKNPVKKWETDNIITADDCDDDNYLYLDAKFDNNTVTVVLDRNDFSKNIEIEVGYGDTVDLSSINTTMDGYEFKGWKWYEPNAAYYSNHTLSDNQLVSFDPSTPITDSAYIYADWKSLKPITIRFHFLKGRGAFYASSFVEKIVPVDVYEGNHVVLSKNIDVSSSYAQKSFVGWYTPEGEKIDLDTFEATEDVTDLYAMYKVRVEFDDFEYHSSSSLDYGEKVSSVPEPTGKDHATFVRWKVVSRDIWYPSLGDTNVSEPYTFDPDIPVTRDMTVQASYQYDAGYGGSYDENEDEEDVNPVATTPFTVHVMVKDGEEYVEKSVVTVDLNTQALESMEEAGEITLDETEDHMQMTYRDMINMMFTMYGSYTAPSDKTLIGISSTPDGPAETYTFNHENCTIYFYYENREDNGKVAILKTGYEFRDALAEFGSVRSVTRTYSVDDIDMENSVIISAYYSKYPVYASYNSDSKTVYIYTEASTIEFNENCSLMFANLEVISLDLGKIDTSKVKDASFMFAFSYFYPDLMPDFDTSNVTNMCGMFFGNKNPSLRVSNLDTGSVTNMGLMFARTSVTSLDLSNFNTSNVTNMAGMFAGDQYLTSVDVSSFDTSNVVNMNRMFYRFGGKVLNLSNFNTSKVEDLQMFALTEDTLDLLDVSGFTFESIPDKQAMQYWIMSVRTIKLGKVEAGKTVPFYVKAYFIDDYDDGIPEHNCRYMTAADDNTKHIYKSLLSVSYYDDDILYSMQYMYNFDELVKPEDPEKDGYTFVGWQYETGDLFNFDAPKGLGGQDLTLYARWVPDKVNTDECKVTYVTDFDTEDVFWVKKGEKIKSMYEPIMAGEIDDYTFLGWMKEDGTFWDFKNDVVTEDIKLYATFDPTMVHVHYIFGEGDGWDSEEMYIPYGETISLDSLEKDGMYEINEVRYTYKKDYTVYRDYSEFKTNHPESEVFDFSTKVTKSFVIYVDCKKLKWRHTFVKEAFPKMRELAEMNSSTMLSTLNEKNIVDEKLVVSGDEFAAPALPDGALAWTDGENFYHEGQTITGANKDVLYVPQYDKDISIDMGVVALFDESGAMKTTAIYTTSTNVKYGDVLKPPADNKVDILGAPTYKWVAIPGSKIEEFNSAMRGLGENITAEGLETIIQSGIGSYYSFDEESLSEKYTLDELIDSSNSKPTILLYQIPAAVNYKLTIPDEISANDHSFQVSFDCGNHFCNDVTVAFNPNEVFLPNTGYTVSLYEDASFERPLTSLTFKEKGSKTVYIKAEPEDGAARVGQDSAEIAFEISDLGYDEEVEAANN